MLALGASDRPAAATRRGLGRFGTTAARSRGSTHPAVRACFVLPRRLHSGGDRQPHRPQEAVALREPADRCVGACFALDAPGRAAAAAHRRGPGRSETAAARSRGSTDPFVRVLVSSPAGSIPVAIGNLTALTVLDLGDNQLSGAWALLASPSAPRAVPPPPRSSHPPPPAAPRQDMADLRARLPHRCAWAV